MSLPREEARALHKAERRLLDIGNGTEKRIPIATRQRARDAMRPFPINASGRWLDSESRSPARRYTHDPAHQPIECLEAALWELAGEGLAHRDENLNHGLVALAPLQRSVLKQIVTALAAVDRDDKDGIRLALCEAAVLLDRIRNRGPHA